MGGSIAQVLAADLVLVERTEPSDSDDARALTSASFRADLQWSTPIDRYGRAVSGTSPKPPSGLCTLSPNGQRARYGVSYVRNICAQAGVGLSETSPDEDVLATDCTVDFKEGPVRVQVKCTSGLTIGGKTKSYTLKPEWLRKWDESLVPVYFVIVVVPKQDKTWLAHQADGTFHRTAAFWQRVPQASTAKSITIPKAQRLTTDTLPIWHSELRAAFSPAGVA
jgi:hypothetical protein